MAANLDTLLSEAKRDFHDAYLGQLLENSGFTSQLLAIYAKTAIERDPKKLANLHNDALSLAEAKKFNKLASYHKDVLAKLRRAGFSVTTKAAPPGEEMHQPVVPSSVGKLLGGASSISSWAGKQESILSGLAAGLRMAAGATSAKPARTKISQAIRRAALAVKNNSHLFRGNRED